MRALMRSLQKWRMSSFTRWIGRSRAKVISQSIVESRGPLLIISRPSKHAANLHSNDTTAGPSRASASSAQINAKTEPPGYQQRHRPDPIPAASTAHNQHALQAIPHQANPRGIHNPALPQKASLATGTVPLSRSSIIDEQRNSSGGPSRSSGGSSATVPDQPPVKRPVGGFAFPNGAVGGLHPLIVLGGDRWQNAQAGSSTAAGQAARALAISNAVAAQSMYPAPIRAESPRIPSGGIDAVAAKASTSMRVHVARLELDENETSVEVGFNGFASARGMKRSVSGESRE